MQSFQGKRIRLVPDELGSGSELAAAAERSFGGGCMESEHLRHLRHSRLNKSQIGNGFEMERLRRNPLALTRGWHHAPLFRFDIFDAEDVRVGKLTYLRTHLPWFAVPRAGAVWSCFPHKAAIPFTHVYRKKKAARKIARKLKRTEGATRQKAFSIGLSLSKKK
jgi:hypothetical protein